MREYFEIIDDNGVIYSGGDEEEIRNIFQAIVDGEEDVTPDDGWHGDLKLIQVHEIHK